MRGGGTSIAGNAVGPGLVVDTSRHLNAVERIDPEARTAIVEPGLVLSNLQRAAAPYGLRFGPDPSTHNRATIGGMIGNNACGSRALGYGRTSDNVNGLDVVTAAGECLLLGSLGPQTSPLLDALRDLSKHNLALLRTEFGTFGRQVSGYSLEHLLPERGFMVHRAFVGTEGTWGVIRRAEVNLVAEPTHRILVVLGYPSMAEAADAVMAVLPSQPIACEGLDRRIVDIVTSRFGQASVPDLPRGDGWLMVELAGDDKSEILSAARTLQDTTGALDSLVVEAPHHQAALWKIREDGAGLVSRTPAGEPAHSGWEDAAVPPKVLGQYLRKFEALLETFGLYGVPYGHFGDGCVHIRIDFGLSTPEGRKEYRQFLSEAADLVAGFGGSMSGEHGDGRARGELLPKMYSRAAIKLFSEVKDLFDPLNLMNPGIIVEPDPVDDNLRASRLGISDTAVPVSLGFSYPHDRGSLEFAVHRCTGVGKCRSETAGSSSNQVMCPSYQATQNEKDSTRGRARVLQEAITGGLGTNPWKSPALHDALDLCLACKGCSSDCPTGVDMGTYKAESLYQRYRGRVRPMSHYTVGWLPRWAALLGNLPWLIPFVNFLTQSAPLQPLFSQLAGVDPNRRIPQFSRHTFAQLRKQIPRRPPGFSVHGPVVLFVDTFSKSFSPSVAIAAIAVLEDAGYEVITLEKPICCGLTWISTGQLDGAKTKARNAIYDLLPHVKQGLKIVGLEPSCTAVLRSDAIDLLGGSADVQAAQEVARATLTLAEILLSTPGWKPPDLEGVSGFAQPHCHHHAVMGWSPDQTLLESAGAKIGRIGGCCGLAGNFGFEKGHFEVSKKVAEVQLLPAISSQPEGAVVLADGFSCRTQIAELSSSTGIHLAQLLAQHIKDRPNV
jgi:FAD/FMN-containing dehydrogenase/Fe-S oxidoreductase